MTAAIAGARRRADGAAAGSCSSACSSAGVGLFPVHAASSRELSPIEDRGTSSPSPRAGRLDHRLHRPAYAQALEAIFACQCPRTSAVSSSSASRWSPRRSPFFRLKPWERAHAQPAGDRPLQLAPQMLRHPRRAGLSDQPALARRRAPLDSRSSSCSRPRAPYEELQRMVDALLAAARTNPGLINLDTDLKLNKPELKVADRPRQGGRPGHRDRHGRPHARDHARRPPGHPLQARRRAVRRHRAGRRHRPTNPHDLRRDLCPQPRRRDDPALQPGHDHTRPWRRASSTTSTSCAPPRSPPTWRRATRSARRSAFSSRRPRRCCRPAAQIDYRGPVARVPRVERRPLLHLPAGAGLHLPGAGGAVRELHRPLHHHADGAAVDDRRAAGAHAHRRHAQRLQPDRPGHPDRPDHQARHPDRRVRQPAARAGPAEARGGDRGGDARGCGRS